MVNIHIYASPKLCNNQRIILWISVGPMDPHLIALLCINGILDIIYICAQICIFYKQGPTVSTWPYGNSWYIFLGICTIANVNPCCLWPMKLEGEIGMSLSVHSSSFLFVHHTYVVSVHLLWFPQALLTFGLALLNSHCFLASDWSNKFPSFHEKLFISFMSN